MNIVEEWMLNYIDTKKKITKEVIVVKKKNRSPCEAEKIIEKKIHKQIKTYLDLVIKEPSCWHTVEVSNNQKGVWAMINQKERTLKGVVTGWPDIEIFWIDEDKLKMIFLEVKMPGKNAEPHQEEIHNKLRKRGHEVYVVHSVYEVEEALKDMGVI